MCWPSGIKKKRDIDRRETQEFHSTCETSPARASNTRCKNWIQRPIRSNTIHNGNMGVNSGYDMPYSVRPSNCSTSSANGSRATLAN